MIARSVDCLLYIPCHPPSLFLSTTSRTFFLSRRHRKRNKGSQASSLCSIHFDPRFLHLPPEASSASIARFGLTCELRTSRLKVRPPSEAKTDPSYSHPPRPSTLLIPKQGNLSKVQTGTRKEEGQRMCKWAIINYSCGHQGRKLVASCRNRGGHTNSRGNGQGHVHAHSHSQGQENCRKSKDMVRVVPSVAVCTNCSQRVHLWIFQAGTPKPRR